MCPKPLSSALEYGGILRRELPVARSILIELE